jgi:hypothetical protein
MKSKIKSFSKIFKDSLQNFKKYIKRIPKTMKSYQQQLKNTSTKKYLDFILKVLQTLNL